VASLFYSYYDNPENVLEYCDSQAERIQCVVSNDCWFPGSLGFGEAQHPELWQYADGVDTMEFLTELD
jgi:hypothetical protein